MKSNRIKKGSWVAFKASEGILLAKIFKVKNVDGHKIYHPNFLWLPKHLFVLVEPFYRRNHHAQKTY